MNKNLSAPELPDDSESLDTGTPHGGAPSNKSASVPKKPAPKAVSKNSTKQAAKSRKTIARKSVDKDGDGVVDAAAIPVARPDLNELETGVDAKSDEPVTSEDGHGTRQGDTPVLPDPQTVKGVQAAGDADTAVSADPADPTDLVPEKAAATESGTYGSVSDSAPDSVPETEIDKRLEDPATDKAVEEIIAEEGDIVLAVEDEKLAAANPKEPVKEPRKHRTWLGTWWGHRRLRYATLAILTLGLLAAALVPQSRYTMLNTAGVRSSVNVTVLDGTTQQPLKNVQVSVDGVAGLTDSKGTVALRKVRLGKATLNIQKRAFETIKQPIIVGWGSNPLAPLTMKGVGTQYTFLITDFLSGKAAKDAEASSGEGNAAASDDGKMVLTLDTAKRADNDLITVTINAPSYRSETVTITVNNKETQSVKMVPSRKHTFVSKRTGKYDVYSVDADGKNEKLLVAGTGLERDAITLIPHQSAETAVLVASRENVRNAEGYLFDTLYTVDLKDGTLTKLDQSEQVQVIGWTADQRLVYVKIAAGASAANPKRHRLMSVNAKTVSDSKELASANYFNDVLMSGDRVYYSPSNAFQDTPRPGLYAVKPDGTGSFQVIDKEIWNVFRIDYDTLYLSAQEGWYSHKLGTSDRALKIGGQSNVKSFLFVDNADKSKSLWADTRDGKGVLLAYEPKARKDATIVTAPGLKTPAYWLNSHTVVYRVADGRQVADYVASIHGGEPKKIMDVTDSTGIDRWYYY